MMVFPEVEELIKKATGCQRVVTTVALMRGDLYSEPVVSGAQGDAQPSESVESSGDSVPQHQDDPISIATYGKSCPPIIGNRPGDRKSPAPKFISTIHRAEPGITFESIIMI
ncbi:hypothetical protein N7478_000540 [Penicillium angulare]|uniref:uncharacterized protein n=1 Tax=Penicillium angulare TaxID=116970 RepID=UPI0025424A13|nr:uncharacterized protein N7478_000540 [Penicillium angulare]KAJ5291289.1 hypothetical protein N7478_000540 [Penicillium angulare]